MRLLTKEISIRLLIIIILIANNFSVSISQVKPLGGYKIQFIIVGIYPSLCELVGNKVENYLDGKSVVSTLKNKIVKVKDYAICQHPRTFLGQDRGIMGYSLPNKKYRFTQWISNNYTTIQPFESTKVKAVELYEYEYDPLATKNLAAETSMKKIVEQLSQQLHQYYQ